MAANRPHYHVWFLAATGRAFFRTGPGFHTRQAAQQWARRRRSDGMEFMVRQCEIDKCKPKL